jgi:hypothetical protein
MVRLDGFHLPGTSECDAKAERSVMGLERTRTEYRSGYLEKKIEKMASLLNLT